MQIINKQQSISVAEIYEKGLSGIYRVVDKKVSSKLLYWLIPKLTILQGRLCSDAFGRDEIFN